MTGAEAVARARSQIGRGMYVLGAGGYDPHGAVDEPWGPKTITHADGRTEVLIGADCSRFALWSWRLPGRIPGFNHGAHSTVADHLNCDSITEDAMHARRIFELVADPRPGDLVVYRSIWWKDGHANDTGHGIRRWIGHIGVIAGVGRWRPGKLEGRIWIPADHSELQVIQCRGPNGKVPGVIASDGYVWEHHEEQWGEGEIRRAMIVRVR